MKLYLIIGIVILVLILFLFIFCKLYFSEKKKNK